MEEEIKGLKKIQLHYHFDGSIPLYCLSKLSGKSIEECKVLSEANEHCYNLTDYLTKFDFPLSLLQTYDNIKYAANCVVNELEKQNVIYAEIRFCPYLHTKNGLSIDNVLEALLEGLNENNHVKTKVIICMMRNLTTFHNMNLINLAYKYKDFGVGGVDLAGDEINYPLDRFLVQLRVAQNRFLNVTCHAGECVLDEMYKAVNLGITRIGHGIKAINDEFMMNELKNKNVYLEVCPTSNINTCAFNTINDHPIKKFYDYGIKVTINTDNDTVSNTNINEEYIKLYHAFNFTIDDFKKMINNAIDCSFMNYVEKLEIKAKINN